MVGKTKTHRVEMEKATTGTTASDRIFGILKNLLTFTKKLTPDLRCSGVLPEFVEITIIAREPSIVAALKAGRCQSIILGNIITEIREILGGYKSWEAKLPKHPAQPKAA